MPSNKIPKQKHIIWVNSIIKMKIQDRQKMMDEPGIEPGTFRIASENLVIYLC